MRYVLAIKRAIRVKTHNIPKIFLTLFILFGQVSLLAWSFHSVLNYYILQEISLDLNFMVEITKKDFKEERVYNNEEFFADIMERDIIGPEFLSFLNSFFYYDRSTIEALFNKFSEIIKEPVEGRLPAWQILAFYSDFPDIGIDRYNGWNFRIISLPGFDIGHAIRHGKLKFGPFEFLEADISFKYFINKSKELLEKGNIYWGLRFLAYALHYLQDIMQPYHTRPGTVPELLWALFNLSNAFKFLSNLHFAYDDIIIYLALYDSENFRDVVKNAKPIYFNTYDELIYEAFIYSYMSFFKVHELLKAIFSDILYERKPTMEDFLAKSELKDFSRLIKETYSIISTMTGVVKGLLYRHLSIFTK